MSILHILCNYNKTQIMVANTRSMSRALGGDQRITRSMTNYDGRITRSMTRTGNVPKTPIDKVKINKPKPWKYVEPFSNSGLWHLAEIPDSELEHIVGFNGPVKIHTGVLCHSYAYGETEKRPYCLEGMTDTELSNKDILTIGKKDQPVTMNQLKTAFARIPGWWYRSGRTFWFEGIRFLKDCEDCNFTVCWGT